MKTKLLVTALIAASAAFASSSAFGSASYSSQAPAPFAQRHEVKQGGYRSTGGVAAGTSQSGSRRGASADQMSSLYRGGFLLGADVWKTDNKF